MRRFFGLVTNELIKVGCKLSTWIMLALVVVSAFGFNMMVFVGTHGHINDYYMGSTFEDQIKELENNKFPGYQYDIERLEYMKAQGMEADAWGWNNPGKPAPYQMDFRYPALENWVALRRALDEQKDNLTETQRAELTAAIDAIKKTVDAKAFTAYVQGCLDFTKTDTCGLVSESVVLDSTEFFQYLVDNKIEYSSWKYMAAQAWMSNRDAYEQAVTTAADSQESLNQLNMYKQEMLIQKYRLDHNVEAYTSDPIDKYGLKTVGSGSEFWDNFGLTSNLVIYVISVLIIIIAGSAISGEFSQGTVKFLLINPTKRWKILVAKYISVIAAAGVMVLLLYVMSGLFSGVFFGMGGVGASHLVVSGNSVAAYPSLLYVLKQYAFGMVGMLSMATLAFAISSLVQSSALAIGVSMLGLLAGSGASAILSQLGMDWARYLIFSNVDLGSIIAGSSAFPRHTLGFALIVIAVYMAVFLLTAWDGFVRRDIK